MGAGLYLATPESGSGPGVLVLHSWWGLNEFFRGFCDRLAGQGFVALAPDLFDGKVATTITQAKELRAKTTAARKESAYKYLIRMISVLLGEPAVRGPDIGVIGFSMGGHWAYWLAQRPELPIAATVTFYAARNGDYATTSSDFLAHFAETDEWVSAAGIRKLERSLTAAGRTVFFYTYPGTGHWFFEQDRVDAFDPEAAALAWDRTLLFLKERLG
ncbi:MAG: dienelactone hydrolase family protein [Armatimonadetes bacterium]|nr:dienelactone hydrolase family protein [Armatimonadota bacterium]